MRPSRCDKAITGVVVRAARDDRPGGTVVVGAGIVDGGGATRGVVVVGATVDATAPSDVAVVRGEPVEAVMGLEFDGVQAPPTTSRIARRQPRLIVARA